MRIEQLLLDSVLLLGRTEVYIAISIYMFLRVHKERALQGLLLLLFSTALNPALKSIFKIPLNPALGLEGYAFPSEHMQAAAIFYGWIMLSSNNYARALLSTLLAAMGAAMVIKGYHDLADIVAAVIVAALVLWGYFQISQKPLFQQHTEYLGLILVAASFVSLVVLYCNYKIQTFFYITFAGLTTLSLAWFCWKRKSHLNY